MLPIKFKEMSSDSKHANFHFLIISLLAPFETSIFFQILLKCIYSLVQWGDVLKWHCTIRNSSKAKSYHKVLKG